MKVLPKILTKLSNVLTEKSAYEMADALIDLGFETEVLEGESEVLDVEITPSRGDAMSHLGIARELQAYFSNQKALTLKSEHAIDKIPDSQFLNVKLKTSLIPQYHGIIVEDLTIIQSPAWLKKELSLMGIRPINSVVDLTNYLMELYGQPLHAFDLHSLNGREITLRESKKGEKVETINSIVNTLPTGVIVGEDAKGLVDLAGIQGGATSEVTNNTNAIFVQSAIFDKSAIRIASKKLAARTDASVRYERGVDPQISTMVLAEFCNFIQTKEFGEAKITGKILAKTAKEDRSTINFDSKKINSLLGTKISQSKQEQYLKKLGFDTAENSVVAPSWRLDIKIWQDIAEEVMRLEGLNSKIPTQKLPASDLKSLQSDWEWAETLKDTLLDLNFCEVQTHSFVSKKDLENFNLTAQNSLLNPLNPDLKYPRPSLTPGSAKVIAQNSWFDPINIFEVGHIFNDSETTSLILAVAGRTQKIEEILRKLALKLSVDADKLIASGNVANFDQKLKDAYKIRKKYVATFEISLADLKQLKPNIPDNFMIYQDQSNYRPVSKFPPSTRDTSIIIDADVNFSTLKNFILTFNSLIENVILLDEFSHEKFGFNKKSVTFRVFYSNINKTLEQEEVDNLNNKLLKSIEKSFEAIIR